jgi:hypothetical protein
METNNNFKGHDALVHILLLLNSVRITDLIKDGQ